MVSQQQLERENNLKFGLLSYSEIINDYSLKSNYIADSYMRDIFNNAYAQYCLLKEPSLSATKRSCLNASHPTVVSVKTKNGEPAVKLKICPIELYRSVLKNQQLPSDRLSPMLEERAGWRVYFRLVLTDEINLTGYECLGIAQRTLKSNRHNAAWLTQSEFDYLHSMQKEQLTTIKLLGCQEKIILGETLPHKTDKETISISLQIAYARLLHELCGAPRSYTVENFLFCARAQVETQKIIKGFFSNFEHLKLLESGIGYFAVDARAESLSKIIEQAYRQHLYVCAIDSSLRLNFRREDTAFDLMFENIVTSNIANLHHMNERGLSR